MEVSDVASLPCVAHTLQLAINEGMLCQRSVSDVIAICRRIVGHFKHSPLAYSRLHSVQIQLGMRPKVFQQDITTRWNSTFYMLKSLLDQKQAIAAYSADYDLPVTLTAHHWSLIENVLSILHPFEQLTREMSSSGASAADVIPSVVALKRLLSKDLETDQGIKNTKKTLLDAVTKRFAKIDSEPLYCIATLIDPRYKDNYVNTDKKQGVHMMLQAQLDLSDGKDAEHPPEDSPIAKKARKENKQAPSLFDMFDEVLQENLSHGFRITPTMPQMDAYIAETPIERNQNPLQYWRVNQARFPALAQTARKYLSAPCTSTDSERLFSSASNVLDSKRNRLHCEKAEKLLFIKKNLPLFLKQQP